MTTYLQDLRFAVQQLRKSPGFTLTVLLTLALGIGANAAIFTLVNAVLLKNLPVSDPKALVRLGDHGDCCVGTAVQRNGDVSPCSRPRAMSRFERTLRNLRNWRLCRQGSAIDR